VGCGKRINLLDSCIKECYIKKSILRNNEVSFINEFIIAKVYYYSRLTHIAAGVYGLSIAGRVGGRTVGQTLQAATGTDVWDMGGQWVSR